MDTQKLQETLGELDRLIEEIREAENEHREAIDRVEETHRAGARNLVHYTALRNRDIRRLQMRLSDVGATRLTTTEPNVLARLQGARNVLSTYLGQELKYGNDEVSGAFTRADDILETHADRLLGETTEDTHSRIMVTLPTEAAHDLDLVRGFVDAGMDLARINCAHDGPEAWGCMIDNVHRAAAESDVTIRIAMDLAGPKLRTGAIAPGPEIARARVKRTEIGEVIHPAKIWLLPNTLEGELPAPPPAEGRPTLTVKVDPDWLGGLAPGGVLSFHDTRGPRREFTVETINEDVFGDGSGVRAVRALGEQNAYVSNTTLIEHEWTRTRVSGIEPSEQRLRLHTGDTLVLTTDPSPADPSRPGTPTIGCTLPEAVLAIEEGHSVLFDDGSIAARAIDTQEVDGHTQVTLHITRAAPGGTNLAAYKGINLPDTELPLPSLTEEDVEALGFVARHADIANVSFIRDAGDVEFLLETLETIAREIGEESGPEAGERARNLGVVLKIETVPGYENLATVLLAGMRHANLGVMVARGDLAVELGFQRMAEVPRFIMNMAEAGHVPTIMATQILESLAKSGLPTRAEITDAAYALRAECVMLNKGPHITDTIRILNDMSAKLGASQRKNRIQLRRIESWENAL
ncbi:pyruvate kinase [Corynebacterium guangdongense]|uniref:pyruvate kinase n=1 Tax=Corynebacterium guangdongense TaxID=1783348 RepID=A0ABU1ZZY3_9CORY|nr:pyruvate kinase [Corynebacterium guangdongense]MDR7330489.1 pyruvate kinase [Corynebacterium guangdongense]WJZ19045.1 Pyruvate kinase [Corynebacterium guangdongense]